MGCCESQEAPPPPQHAAPQQRPQMSYAAAAAPAASPEAAPAAPQAAAEPEPEAAPQRPQMSYAAAAGAAAAPAAAAVEPEPEAADYPVDVPLAAACAEVWARDGNGLEPGAEYELDIQGYTTYGNKGRKDWAQRPLFKYVAEDALTRPTYCAFVALLDNYSRDVGVAEVETAEEKAEVTAFLDAVTATEPVRYAHAWLRRRGAAPEGDGAWRALLHTLWFKLYRSTRGGPDDSCGFEHVFVGEEKERRGELTGFHNWIQLYMEEQAGRFDYHGYVSRNREKPPPDARVLTLQFSATDPADGSVSVKPVSTSFIGVSPELEIALYTLIALGDGGCDGDKRVVPVCLGGCDVDINCITWRRGRDVSIRTAYPSM